MELVLTFDKTNSM